MAGHGNRARPLFDDRARSDERPAREARRWRDAEGEHIDVRGLPPPEPLVAILRLVATAADGTPVIVHHDRDPLLLYPELAERRLGGRAHRRRSGRSAAATGARAVTPAAGAFLGGATSRLLPASIPFRFFGAAVVFHLLAWLALLAGAERVPRFAGGLGLAAGGAAPGDAGRAGDERHRREPAVAAGGDAPAGARRRAGRPRSGGCTRPAWRALALGMGLAAPGCWRRARRPSCWRCSATRRCWRATCAARAACPAWWRMAGPRWLPAGAAGHGAVAGRWPAGMPLLDRGDGAGAARRVRGLWLHGPAGARACRTSWCRCSRSPRRRRRAAVARVVRAGGGGAGCWPALAAFGVAPQPLRVAGHRPGRRRGGGRAPAADASRRCAAACGASWAARSRWCASAGPCWWRAWRLALALVLDAPLGRRCRRCSGCRWSAAGC